MTKCKEYKVVTKAVFCFGLMKILNIPSKKLHFLGVLSLGETSWEKPFILAKVVQKIFFLETMLDNVVLFLFYYIY